jgi:hypothetical protein
MKRIGRNLIALFACLTTLPHLTVNAQGRGPSAKELRGRAPAEDVSPATRAAKLAELEVWLERLVGPFRYDGKIKVFYAATSKDSSDPGCEVGVCFVYGDAQGDGSCAGIGEGSGVTCSIAVPWPPLLVPFMFIKSGSPGELKWPGPFLDQAKVLYGVDPDSLGIRMLLVDGQSIAVEALGFLKGDTATFSTECMGNLAGPRCKRNFRIRAWPDEKRIELQFEVKTLGNVLAGYTFNLRRQ